MKTEEEIREAIRFNEDGMNLAGTTDLKLACKIFCDALRWSLGEKVFASLDEGVRIAIKEKKLSREAANQ